MPPITVAVPSVATNELTFSRVMIRPLISPTAVQMSTARMIATNGATCCISHRPTAKSAPSPALAPTDRSNSPTMSGTMAPRATIRMIACWAKVWRKFVQVKKLDVFQAENTTRTIRSASRQAVTAEYLEDAAASAAHISGASPAGLACISG